MLVQLSRTTIRSVIVTMLIRKTVKQLFGKRTLFVTNVVSSGVLMGFGDWIVQKAVEKTSKNQQKTDWARTGECHYFSPAPPCTVPVYVDYGYWHNEFGQMPHISSVAQMRRLIKCALHY